MPFSSKASSPSQGTEEHYQALWTKAVQWGNTHKSVSIQMSQLTSVGQCFCKATMEKVNLYFTSTNAEGDWKAGCNTSLFPNAVTLLSMCLGGCIRQEESPAPLLMGAPGSATGNQHPHSAMHTFEKWLSCDTRAKGGCVFLPDVCKRKRKASCWLHWLAQAPLSFRDKTWIWWKQQMVKGAKPTTTASNYSICLL